MKNEYLIQSNVSERLFVLRRTTAFTGNNPEMSSCAIQPQFCLVLSEQGAGGALTREKG